MSNGMFGEQRNQDGSLTATFHAKSVSFLPGNNEMFPQGIRFSIVRGGTIFDSDSIDDSVVHGGFLLLSPERASILKDLLPGSWWTALNVTPQILHGTSPLLCLLDLTMKGSGSIIRHPRGSQDPVCADVCSGIGGWHFGGRPFGIRPTFSVEIDEEVADVMCANHHLQKFTPQRLSDATPDELSLWSRTGILVNGDFTDECFWENMAHRGISTFFASLPCPPWSRLTGANGLCDARGRLFHQFAFMMNVFRPVVIALENLPGLVTHPDWGCILRSFEDVGFVLSHESVDSLSNVLPMSRDRVSLIFTNKSHASELTDLKLRAAPMPKLVFNPDPRHLGVYHDEEPVQVIVATTVTPAQEDLLTRKDMWPGNWRITKPVVDNRIHLVDRVVCKHTIMPCAVAKYAQPQNINLKLLLEKGLVMKLTQSPLGPRWISPIEIQFALGLPITFMHSRKNNLAFHVLGNSISPAHAATTIARVVALYPKICSKHVGLVDALGDILSQVPRYPHYVVDFDESFYWTVPRTSVMRPLTDFTEQADESITPIKRAFAKGCVANAVNQVPPTELDLTGPSTVATIADELFSCSRVVAFDDVLQHVLTVGNTDLFQMKTIESFLNDHDNAPGKNFWISGFSPRGCTQDPSWTLRIDDSQHSWTSYVTTNGETTVGSVVQLASPFIDSFHCASLMINGREIDWDSVLPHGDLIIVFRKAHRVIHVAGTPLVLNIFCDPIDTVQSVCNAHPLLASLNGSLQFVVFQGFSSHGQSLDFVKLGPHDSLLKLDCPCLTALFVDTALVCQPGMSTSTMTVEHIHDTDSEPDAITNSDHALRSEPSITAACTSCTIAVVHPFTGKFHEVKTQSNISVAQLLDDLHPAVPGTVQIVAEVNTKRVGMHQLLSTLPCDCTIRFRHFSANGGAPVVNSLKTELVARGVPPEQVTHRASAVLNTIGEEAVQDAFLTHDPWKVLKQSCSEKQIRLVHPSELKAHQHSRREAPTSRGSKPAEPPSQKAKGNSKGKGNNTTQRLPLPSWDDISFPKGFVDSKDEPLKILSKSQVLPDAHGICPVTLNEAQAFLSSTAGNNLSDDTLALLVVGHVLSVSDVISHVAIPTTLNKTAEPVLLPATLIQLGASQAAFSFNGPATAVDTVPSTVLEILIEANRCDYWDSVSKPLDIVVQCVPLLRSRENLLSHWSWKWTDGKRHVVSPSSAFSLHGYIRIPEAILDDVLKLSGPCGVSMWPKSADRQNDPRYSHIPVGAQTFDEAAAVAQSTPHGLGFVHHNQKWLVRCRREHYPEARQTLVPQGFVLETACIGTTDKLFVLQAPNSDLSCTTKAINSGLEGIGWKASVVKSIGPTAWLIASAVDPPNPHVAMNRQIMSIRPYHNQKPSMQFVAAPSQGQGAAHNPWSSYVPTTHSAASEARPKAIPGPTASRFEELEKTMSKKLEGMIDQKLAVLEGKIASIGQQSQQQSSACSARLEKIEDQMTNNASTISQLDQRIQSNHEQMLSQMREMFKSFAPGDEGAKRRKSEPTAPTLGD